MRAEAIIGFLFLLVLPALTYPLKGQVEGESEITTIILKRPAADPQEQKPDVSKDVKPDSDFTNHALLIGINRYVDSSLTDLDNPVEDAIRLQQILTGKFQFETENVILLKNPTRAEIIRELDRYSARLTRKDNLLIFYAGHGYWDPKKETGFWLPSDADSRTSVNWIRNSTIQGFVDDIDTQHTLLISDACFAGSIFKTRSGFRDAPVAVSKLYSLPSRKAMTSGNIELVPDRSVFIEFLLKRLAGFEGKYLPANDLFNSFRVAVLNNSPNIPRYEAIQDTGDEGGEYIFIRKE